MILIRFVYFRVFEELKKSSIDSEVVIKKTSVTSSRGRSPSGTLYLPYACILPLPSITRKKKITKSSLQVVSEKKQVNSRNTIIQTKLDLCRT